MFYEITLYYFIKKQELIYSCMLIAQDEKQAFDKARTALFIESGQWYEIERAMITEVTDEEYFILPEFLFENEDNAKTCASAF